MMNPELDAAHRRLADIRRRLADLRLQLAEQDRLKRLAQKPVEPIEPVRRDLH
jgi:hypothetical protein